MHRSSWGFLLFLTGAALTGWLLLGAAGRAAAMSVGGIVAPAAGSVVQGVAQVEGVAQHPGFRKWQLDLLVHGDESKASFIAVGETMQTEAGLMAHLDTTLFPNGQHKLRLRVVYTGLNYDEYFTPIIIGNTGTPAVIPTPGAETPTGAAGAEQKPKDDLLNDPALVEAQGGGRHKLPYAIAVLPPIGQGATEGKRWIEVDLSEYQLIAWQGDQVVFQTTVAIGKPGFETITGNFKVYRKYDKTRMRGVDYDTPDVPWTMYYKGGFAVHGAYWHNEFGTQRSHGCVNVKLHEAKVLYEWAEVGTEVVVHE
jgi:lipoprotein-anchoring transpeptidase ErfK/SrfK